MMSPAFVFEPTCQRLKGELLEGKWPPGARLDAVRIAEDYGVSATPVRDCLNRLVGEGLVDFEPGHGYHVAAMSEKKLDDLLAVNQWMLTCALDAERSELPLPEIEPPPASYALKVRGVFAGIAWESGNAVLVESVFALSDRLHATRVSERTVFEGAEDEINTISDLARHKDMRLGTALVAYHQRRRARVSVLVQLLR